MQVFDDRFQAESGWNWQFHPDSAAVTVETAASFKASVHFCYLRRHYFREARNFLL
jgi:hypothetical protein